ncbi:TPA: GGDEF domain-containing protein, partial [Klebsiella pneumoniae]
MSTFQRTESQGRLQPVLLKRFAMAIATYSLVLGLFWLGFGLGLYRGSLAGAFWLSALAMASQLVFAGLFFSGFNQRLRDPGLTEAQIIAGLLLQTFMLLFEEPRGVLLMFYPALLMFGAFQLRLLVFVRCALLALCLCVAMQLWAWQSGHLESPRQALFECVALAITLLWQCLFASYVRDLRQHMRQRRQSLQSQQESMRGLLQQMESLAITDELTGLHNRRHFMQVAGHGLSRLEPGQQHGLALIDLDHFKQINDRLGHAVGDQVLQGFAQVADSCLRDS